MRDAQRTPVSQARWKVWSERHARRERRIAKYVFLEVMVLAAAVPFASCYGAVKGIENILGTEE